MLPRWRSARDRILARRPPVSPASAGRISSDRQRRDSAFANTEHRKRPSGRAPATSSGSSCWRFGSRARRCVLITWGMWNDPGRVGTLNHAKGQQIVVSLEAYMAAHGSYAPNLDALVERQVVVFNKP